MPGIAASIIAGARCQIKEKCWKSLIGNALRFNMKDHFSEILYAVSYLFFLSDLKALSNVNAASLSESSSSRLKRKARLLPKLQKEMNICQTRQLHSVLLLITFESRSTEIDLTQYVAILSLIEDSFLFVQKRRR